MVIAISAFATLLSIAWLILLGRVSDDDWVEAAKAEILDNQAAVQKLIKKEKVDMERISMYRGVVAALFKSYIIKYYNNSIGKQKRIIESLQRGDMKSINPLTMPGYVLQREAEAIGRSSARKAILSKCFELYGKKSALHKTSQILAKMLSYPIIGVALSLMLGIFLLGMEMDTAGYAVIGIGTALVLVLTYAIYDELSSKVIKRRISISKQLPNAVSKLALLVTSGMIMDRAWKETAYSHDTELYLEMRKTSDELDNSVSPESAYSNFINRCNTKETARLASAIMQNLSKGNAEIGKLLKDMAQEAWQERRHIAKRDAEKANSKLMIPTMLLFLAILVMLMVPIAMSFSSI